MEKQNNQSKKQPGEAKSPYNVLVVELETKVQPLLGNTNTH
jgi:hypothetical protein